MSQPVPMQGGVGRWKLNLVLFLLTTLSVFWAGAVQAVAFEYAGKEIPEEFGEFLLSPALLIKGWIFAVPLMGILLFHEFGHWFAARLHRVPASLPFFIPLPLLSLLGTMGAVIAMPDRIRSRNALLDIGAAGPLAGMVVAVPVLMLGLSLSPVGPSSEHYIQEGQCLLYWLLKWIVVGPIPDGHDVQLHPTALAGWAGLLLTMINMLPWGQLDGGHIAYALFGQRQNAFARLVRAFLPVLFLGNFANFAIAKLSGDVDMSWGMVFSNSMFWLMWFVVTGVLGRAFGANHPPTEREPLTPSRRWVAVGCLALFVLLFMPTPISVY